MPIWLRKYTYSEIVDYHKKLEKSQSESKTSKNKQTLRPDINPTYSSKASKK